MGKKRKTKGRKGSGFESRKPIPQSERERVAAQVTELANSLCRAEGLELVHVEFIVDGFMNLLRVYIDKSDGITMEDCTTVSRQLGDILDASVSVSGEYRLEVSSPGIYRQLYSKEDYSRFAGQWVRLQLKAPMDGKKKLTGILNGITSDGFVDITIDGSPVKVEYSSVTRARLTEDNGEK